MHGGAARALSPCAPATTFPEPIPPWHKPGRSSWAGATTQWKHAPNELQAGVEALEPQNSFWGVNLSDDLGAKKDTEALMSLLSRHSKSVP